MGTTMIFKRKVYNELLEWKKNYGTRYSCLLEGARRVGKTTVVEEFAKNEFRSYILIDFSNIDSETKDIFDMDLENHDMFFLRLQNKTGVTLYEKESAIIFDEVQLYPKARQALKHFTAEGRYYFIETGSLISIRKNTKDILIPSEEHKIQVYPMDYEEFLWACNSNYDLNREQFEKQISLNKTNDALMRQFRLYMSIGGMPQVVQKYFETNNFEEIDKAKQEIIHLYLDDLKKIDASGRLSAIFLNIPAQLASNKTMFSITTAIGKRKTEKDEERLYDLIDSKLVLPCFRVNEPVSPLLQNKDFSKYKLYVFDTGIFTTMLLMNQKDTVGDLYGKLLSNKLDANLGFLYENVVAQMIASRNRDLYYYTWRKEGSTHSYEIDFILESIGKVIPIEVKSSGIKNHKSIDEIYKKYPKKIKDRYLLSQKDLGREGELKLLPIYLVPALLENV